MVRLGLVVALVALWGAPAHALDRGRPMGLYVSGTTTPLAMLDSRIEITVRGPILETVVVQRFRNATDHATEATYIFPLPADAAVSGMAMRIGTRTITAAIERREAAQRRYEAAVAAGVAAALLDQERPDVFTQTVSAIPARGTVEVTLRYDALARYEAGVWELVLPMVVAPRYVPGTPSGLGTTGSGRSPDTDRAPDASRVTPAASPGAGGSTAVAIHFVDEPAEVTSPTHELGEPGAVRRDIAFSDARSDHDAIVRWRAPAASAGWVERDGDGGFAAVVVEAGPVAPPPHAAPVRAILAIDRAATTRGDADAVEHPVVRALLGALGKADRVRVIGSDAIGWSPPDDVRAAIDRAWATPAGPFDLTRVLEGAHPEGAAIVLVSDGLVADDPAAIAAARRLDVPVHVIGIGSAPARATLARIAAATGGSVRYAVGGDDLNQLARAVAADLATPPAPVTVNWGTLAASDVEPAVLPRLGAGQAMIVVARIKRVQAANARARGELFAFEALAPARAIEGAITPRGPLARRWARERLGDLLAGKHDRAMVTSHALAYGLASPYTSLVAIGSDVVVQGGVKHSIAVPVSLPAGMQWHAVKQGLDVDTRVKEAPGPVASERPAPPKTPIAAAPSPAPPPAPARTPARPARPAHASGGADDSDEDARSARSDDKHGRSEQDRASRKPASSATKKEQAPRPGAEAPRQPELTDEELAKLAEQEAKTEVITVTGSLIGRKEVNSPSPVSVVDRDSLNSTGSSGEALTLESTGDGSPRALRLTAALGGGLAFDHGAHSLLALDVRIETNRLYRLGAEGALWLVDGDAEGRSLVSFARTGLARRFELGLGAGLQFGHGTGLAGSLRLRIDTPLRHVAGYLRYDAALLLTRPSVEGEHAASLGLELSY
ncbi:MAG TPA: VIT domain-containing protein [Kofleriaceae bacterium]|nr:VIT domain-containing protein [Kofleriaceae bacterium]